MPWENTWLAAPTRYTAIRQALRTANVQVTDINVTLGSLDEAAAARPTKQHGIESRVPWWQDLFHLPGMTTADDPPPSGLAALESYQRRDGDV